MKRRTFLNITLAAVPLSIAAAPAPAERSKRAVLVTAGGDRFSEHIKLGSAPNDCKVSAQDTDGAVSVFEFTSPGKGGPPRHVHPRSRLSYMSMARPAGSLPARRLATRANAPRRNRALTWLKAKTYGAPL